MKTNTFKNKMKKGMTLFEMVMVMLVAAVILYLIYPTIMFNYNKTVINSAITNDIKMISQAVNEWRNTDGDSDGTYRNVTTSEVIPYLPTQMSYDAGTNSIKSSGLKGGISYQLISDVISTNGDSIKILVNFTEAITTKNYDTRTITYAETSALNTLKGVSSDQSTSTTNPLATALGAANAAFTSGGTQTDGLCGVSKLKF